MLSTYLAFIRQCLLRSLAWTTKTSEKFYILTGISCESSLLTSMVKLLSSVIYHRPIIHSLLLTTNNHNIVETKFSDPTQPTDSVVGVGKNLDENWREIEKNSAKCVYIIYWLRYAACVNSDPAIVNNPDKPNNPDNS